MDELKSITASNQAEVSRQLKTLYSDLVQAQDEMKNASGEKMTSLFERMAKGAMSVTEHCMLRAKVQTILQSLTFDKIADRESNIPRAHQDTFQWAVSETRSETTLPGWLRSGEGVYWIEGKAGSGKSTLMKFLQQDPRTRSLLEEWADGRPLALVSHYFWAPGTDMQRSLLGLFRTLLFQIFLKDPELIGQICGSRMSQTYGHMQPWTLQELEACFETLSKIQDLTYRFCFLIDGLDEFEGDIARLIDIIRSISRSNSVKICVASRPWLPFQNEYGTSPRKLSVHEFTKEDITKYAQDKLIQNKDYQQLRSRSLGQADSLVREISDAADGVFFWVYLVVRDLLRGLSNSDDLMTLQRRLRAMPRDLHGYFERMLDSIDEIYWTEAHSLLSILAYTRLPLNTLLTWAHRESREFSFTYIDNLSDFAPHQDSMTIENKASAWRQMYLQPTDYDSIGVPADSYDAQLEKRRIVARCKDLVHVSGKGATFSEFDDRLAYQVMFLHRTVADFVGPALDKRAKRDQVGEKGRVDQSLLPVVALADTYMALILSEILPPYSPELVEYHKWVMCLALEAKQHSPSTYLHLMHTYCTVLSMTMNDMDSWNPDLLVGTAMASDTVTRSCRRDRTWRSDWEQCFWVLHCRDCNANYAGVLDRLVKTLFHSMQVPSLLADGTVRVEERPELNLRVVEALVRNWWPGFGSSGWRACLRDLEGDHPLRQQRLPVNIYDVCLIFIRCGAPRFLNDGMDALGVLRKIPAIQEADPTGKLLEQEFFRASQG